MRSASGPRPLAKDLKAESRRQIRHRFASELPSGEQSDERRKRSQAICRRLLEVIPNEPATWAAFQPHGSEPDIRELFEQTPLVTWTFPRMNGERLEFRKPAHEQAHLTGRWGLREPDPSASELVALANLRGLLIPGLGFDLNCNRLGRGGGHYDRALTELANDNPDAIKIGVAFDLQILGEPLPTEPFDQPVDWVVTETRRLERKPS